MRFFHRSCRFRSVGSKLGRHRWYRSVVRFSQRNRLWLWIHKRMPGAIAEIEPRLHCLRRIGWPLIEGDDWFPSGAQALVRNREEGPVKMFFVLTKHLHDAPVGWRIHQLEYVSSRRQHLARNLNRPTECEHNLLVIFIGGGALGYAAH